MRHKATVLRIGQDPDVFEVFYREHIDAVQRFVARRATDPHLVADLTAEVFLAAIDSAHTYRPERGTPLGWLYGVARNVVAAEQRRQVRERRAQERSGGRRLLTADDVVRLEERIDAEARAREVLAAVGELPAGERAVLELVALGRGARPRHHARHGQGPPASGPVGAAATESTAPNGLHRRQPHVGDQLMNETRQPLNSFEDRLLSELRAQVAERSEITVGKTRRRPRTRTVLVAAGALAVVGASLVAPIVGGDKAGAPAYAVTEDNGTVTIRVDFIRNAEEATERSGDLRARLVRESVRTQQRARRLRLHPQGNVPPVRAGVS